MLRKLSEVIKLGLHYKYVAEEMGARSAGKLIAECDASAAIGFANNTSGRGRMKHTDLRQSWVRELHDRDEVDIAKVAGEENPTDFLTMQASSTNGLRTWTWSSGTT